MLRVRDSDWLAGTVEFALCQVTVYQSIMRISWPRLDLGIHVLGFPRCCFQEQRADGGGARFPTRVRTMSVWQNEFRTRKIRNCDLCTRAAFETHEFGSPVARGEAPEFCLSRWGGDRVDLRGPSDGGKSKGRGTHLLMCHGAQLFRGALLTRYTNNCRQTLHEACFFLVVRAYM